MEIPKLPKDWSEVTVGTYQKLVTVYKLHKKEAVPGELDRQFISILSNLAISEIEKFKMGEINEMKKRVAWAYVDIPETKLPLEFDHNGKHYKVVIYSDGLTGRQHKDMLTIGDKGNQVVDYTNLRWNIIGSDENIHHMHTLLACNCIPKNDKGEYEYKGYTEVAEEFLSLRMTVAFPLYLFFSNVGMSFSRSLQTYSLKKTLKNLKNLKKELRSLQKEQTIS